LSRATFVPLPELYVQETRIGTWFLQTDTWVGHVLRPAIADLERLILDRRDKYPVIADIGCGTGRSFALLREHFHPERIIGIDACPEMIAACQSRHQSSGIPIELYLDNGSQLTIPDQSIDLVFCHQTFHHFVDQLGALREMHRVLKPGGLLLIAESTRTYIHSWVIRLFFRHPMEVQRSAVEYVDMIRNGGFEISPVSISNPNLWWSRKDFGICRRFLKLNLSFDREDTLVNIVAVRR
jgi:SAM-dependent methyltransferase